MLKQVIVDTHANAQFMVKRTNYQTHKKTLSSGLGELVYKED
jgi:hypothetical protein